MGVGQNHTARAIDAESRAMAMDTAFLLPALWSHSKEEGENIRVVETRVLNLLFRLYSDDCGAAFVNYTVHKVVFHLSLSSP